MIRIKQILFFVLVLSFASCNNSKLDIGEDSHGNINEISIIIDDVLWNGEIGDSLRKKLAAPVEGLTQEEPLFTLNQYDDKVFDGGLTHGRNIIIVDMGDGSGYSNKQNKYCRSQNVFTLKGKSVDELLQLIEMHTSEIIREIKETEIAENQERNVEHGLIGQDLFKERYGLSIKVPSTYNYAIKNDSFIWLKKDIPSGNTSIMIYRVPCFAVEKDRAVVSNIIKMRDSIGNRYVHGKDPHTFMVTEEAYSPYFFTTSLNNRMAFETRGNWEMENDFMNGPFINYAIRDAKHNGYLIVEGFIYSPSSPKRDLIIELESIIRSVKFI